MSFAMIAVTTVLAYLLGAVPVGILVCRLYGKDPRTVGSGRTGATNVYRAVGLPGGLVTVAGDVLKATAAVALAGALAPDSSAVTFGQALAAVAAILGHNHSVYIGFRGGAGATPNLGGLLAIFPLAFVPTAVAAGLVWTFVRIASVATLTVSALVLAVTVWLFVEGVRPGSILLYGIGQAVLVVWALRPNIARLVRGDERRISLSREHLTGMGQEGERPA